MTDGELSTPYRLVVSEYEVPKVFVCKSDTFFLVHPVVCIICILLPAQQLQFTTLHSV